MNTDVKTQLTAWSDKESRREIKADPGKYARELGMDVEGKEVMVTTCTEDTLYFPIDELRASGDLSPDQLGGLQAAGGLPDYLQSAALFLPAALIASYRDR